MRFRSVALPFFSLFFVFTAASASESFDAYQQSGLEQDLASMSSIHEMRFSKTELASLDLPNLRGANGQSLLHVAVQNGDEKLLKFLLKQGLNPLKANHDGLNALDMAIGHGRLNILSQLLDTVRGVEHFPAAEGLFDDPRLVYWSYMYWADEKPAMLKLVEQDLVSDQAHPLAALVWSATHIRLGTMEEAYAETGADLKQALKHSVEVERLTDTEKTDELLALFAPETTFGAADFFVLVDLASAAQSHERYAESKRYLETGMRLFPNAWQFVWMYENRLHTDESLRARAAQFATEPEMAGTLAGNYVKTISSARNWQAEDRLAEQRQHWLGSQSQDARLQTSIAYNHASNWRYAEALPHIQKSIALFPWYSNSTRPIYYLARLGELEQAERYAALTARWYETDESEIEALTAKRFATELIDEGNKGLAREVLETALKAHPGNLSLAEAMATLEESDKRWVEALSWAEEVLKGDPNASSSVFELQLNVLDKDGARGQVIEQYQQAIEKGGFLPKSIHMKGLEALKSAERWSEFGNQLETLLTTFPDAKEFKRMNAENLWRQNRNGAALKILVTLLEEHPRDSTTLDLWVQYAESEHDAEYVEANLQQRLMDQAWNDVVAAKLLAFSQPNASLEEKNGFWAVVEADNDTLFFACNKRVINFVSMRDYERAWRAAYSCQVQAEANSAPVTEQLNTARHAIYVIERWSKASRLDPEFVTSAAEQWNEISSRYSESLSNIYRYQEQVCQALQDRECAAEALYQASLIDPSDTGTHHDLVAKYRNELTVNQTIGYGARMLARDPYNISKVNSFLHKQVRWAGSSIVALKAIAEARERGLSPGTSFERDALGSLGDPHSKFEGYMQGTYPGESQRYVQWFESSRRAALNDEAKQIRYDFEGEHPGIEIILPSGEVATRRDHHTFGKIVYLSKGAGFVRFGYTEEGLLNLIEESSGKRVTLSYNDAGEIDVFTTADGRELLFEYNESSKPINIEMKGIGSMFIEYDEQDEIIKVDSEQGHAMALQVTQAFQELLSLVKYAENADQLDQLPSFDLNDPELDELRADVEQEEYGSQKFFNAQERLAEYLIDHIKDSNDYFYEALSQLETLIDEGRDAKKSKRQAQAARAINLWQRLHRAVKPHGLPEYEFAVWSDLRNWLVAYSLKSKNKEAKKLLAEIDAEPLEMLQDAHWLNRSRLANSGFWKRSGDDALYGVSDSGAARNGLVKQDVLIRANGDTVVATNQGISVRREGHWQWFGFDDATGRLSNNMSPIQLSDSSDILALEETADGTLWLGSARGLYALQEGYLAGLKRWRATSEGMPSPRVNTLSSAQNLLLVGTAKGVVSIQSIEGELGELEAVADIKAKSIKAMPYATTPTFMALTDSGLDLVSGDEVATISEDATMFAYSYQNDAVYWLAANGLVYSQSVLEIEGEFALQDGGPRILARPSDLLSARKIHELNVWAIPSIGETLVVNTDIAMNVLNNNYFQAMPLPYEVARGGLAMGPMHSAAFGDDLAAVTTEGVYRFTPSEITQLGDNKVFDLLTDDVLELTFMATGDSIRTVDHEDRSLSYWFSGVNAEVLAQNSAGDLITHDYNMILSFERGSPQPKELFNAMPATDESGWQGSVNDILVDSNDIIWVASGSSVFRYENSEVEEFNYLVDAEAFPSRSPMIFRIYEDAAGDIFAVASDEGHLSHNGIDLEGGALKWNGKGFDNLGQDPHWFTTSYTKISDDTSIVGTQATFVREKAGQRQSFTDLQDVTFTEMAKTNKMLWLVGDGKQIGDGNSWLFPTAGGVAVYHEGQWLYPDRLNQLLPEDQSLGQYGARTVHAVSVDKDGTVYAGTDLGLLIYRADGIESLLTDNYRGQLAFSTQEVMKHRELSDVFLNAIDPQSPQGKLLNRYQALDSEIVQAQLRSDRGSAQSGMSAEGDARQSERSMSEELKARIKLNERNRQRLLARIEKEEPGLFQMLRFDPREASAMHERLGDDQALIQFLPTSKTLQVQVVTTDGAVIRQVDVSRDELMQESIYAAVALRDGVLDLYDFKTRGDGDYITDIEDMDDVDLSEEGTRDRLAWLYDKMLRPIERDLDGKKQIFVTSVGSLTYLPFGALVRDNSENLEYAVERYNFGVLPSLFHYGLVVDYEESYLSDMLFISDPDGSLPGAREEVKSISSEMLDENVILEGGEATLSAVDQFAPESRMIHFATHGVLDEESPADSYLLLADERRLSVVDISTMDLSQTDLVVLSACQSGIGSSGLEYATLARAFAHAKVPSVLASYWEVHDEATKMLMTNFYQALQDDAELDYFSALSTAQRAMIKEGGKASHPSAWSGFSVFGRP